MMDSRSKLLAVVGTGVVVATLAGCTTTDHVYSQGRCLTCINNPITGEPVNYNPDEIPIFDEQDITVGEAQQVTTSVTGDGRGSFRIASGVDIDTAYARLRSGFRFRAPVDFSDSMSDGFQQRDGAYHHEANPGSFYRLSDYERQVINGVEHSIVLRAQIERDGSGSRINVEFSPSGTLTYNADEMQDALEQRFDAVLR
ncbi:hypothetical protein [Vreelandella olivaria]|uniref:hypothetical protein n=1 Tax=Vreelandella olivaria TaxID=390919 RepID=UPI00201F8D95|nr:hypothetical protein [Halomonas olivaria]